MKGVTVAPYSFHLQKPTAKSAAAVPRAWIVYRSRCRTKIQYCGDYAVWGFGTAKGPDRRRETVSTRIFEQAVPQLQVWPMETNLVLDSSNFLIDVCHRWRLEDNKDGQFPALIFNFNGHGHDVQKTSPIL